MLSGPTGTINTDAPPPAIPALDSIANHIATNNGNMAEAINQLEQITDRLVGMVPMPIATPANSAVVQSTSVGKIDYHLEEQGALLNRLNYVVNRLGVL